MKPPAATPRRVALASALLGLLFVMVSFRTTAVDVFFHRADLLPDTTAAGDSIAPHSVIAFRIDPETNATGVIDVTPPPPPPPPPPVRPDTTRVLPEEPAPGATTDLDVDDLLDQEAGPREGTAPVAVAAAVPPRPIEITWPETRQLKQCIGESVTVRILVSEEGKVKDAQVVPSDVLPACADAALVAARHIRFIAGRQGGVPITMWTEVRIDFQRRD
jgi:TonB family protein